MAKKKGIDQLIKSEWNRIPEIKQLTIFDAMRDSAAKNGSCVPQKSATHEPTHEHIQWVQEYYVTRRGKKHKYFRFCYLEEPGNIGSCVRRHLPGGNIQSQRALALKEKVENAIANGMSVRAIFQIITSSTRS